MLAKIDFKSRYYYHKLGIIWALIRPAFELLVYYVIFKTIFRNSIEHFELFLFGGLLVWYFFVEGTSKGITILQTKYHLIDNIQFDKKGLFLSSTGSALMGFGFNFMAYLIISISVGVNPFNFKFFTIFPLIIILVFGFIMGISMILATLSIYLKDIQHVWDMVIMAGFWLTPIVYSTAIIPEHLLGTYMFNPMAAVVISVQDILLYNRWPSTSLLGYFSIWTFLAIFIGVYVFKKFGHKAAEKL